MNKKLLLFLCILQAIPCNALKVIPSSLNREAPEFIPKEIPSTLNRETIVFQEKPKSTDVDDEGNTTLLRDIFDNSELKKIKEDIEKYKKTFSEYVDQANDYGQTPLNLALERNLLEKKVKNNIAGVTIEFLSTQTKQKPCLGEIQICNKVPWENTSSTISSWMGLKGDRAFQQVKNKKLEGYCLRMKQGKSQDLCIRETIIFHTFPWMVDLFIKSLGIKVIEGKNIRYYIVGMIEDNANGSKYYGLFDYLIDEKGLFHRFFIPVESSDFYDSMQIYSITKPEEKIHDKFYDIDTYYDTNAFTLKHECISGLNAVTIRDASLRNNDKTTNNVTIHLFKFNSSRSSIVDEKTTQLFKLVSKSYKMTTKDRIKEIQDLLNKGADINSEMGQISVLMKAIEFGDDVLVKFILDNKARVNAKFDYAKITPLIVATNKGNPKVVLQLLESGAKVNAQDKDGFTALMHAVANDSAIKDNYDAKKNNSLIIEMLLKHGADQTITDNNGKQVSQYPHSQEIDIILRNAKPLKKKPIKKLPVKK